MASTMKSWMYSRYSILLMNNSKCQPLLSRFHQCFEVENNSATAIRLTRYISAPGKHSHSLKVFRASTTFLGLNHVILTVLGQRSPESRRTSMHCYVSATDLISPPPTTSHLVTSCITESMGLWGLALGCQVEQGWEVWLSICCTHKPAVGGFLGVFYQHLWCEPPKLWSFIYLGTTLLRCVHHLCVLHDWKSWKGTLWPDDVYKETMV